MAGTRRSALIASALTLTLILPAFAQEAAPDFATLEAAQNAANTALGERLQLHPHDLGVDRVGISRDTVAC